MTSLAPDPARPWRLSARMRKSVLVVHIASAGAWIGIDVVMGVVVFTALLAERRHTRALCYQALELFAGWPLVVTGLVCLAEWRRARASARSTASCATGGWRSNWSLNIVLVALVPVAVAAGSRSRWPSRAAGSWRARRPRWRWETLIFPPIVSPSALLVAFVLAVFKPWGRIRKRPAPREEER